MEIEHLLQRTPLLCITRKQPIRNVKFVNEMMLSMDQRASDRSWLILGVSDDEDLSKDCYYTKDLGGGQASR